MGILDLPTRAVIGGAKLALRILPRRPKALGDADLTNKVRTELLRGTRGPAKGAIDINVVDGEVYLRGEAKTPEAINRLEEKARAIPEVREVHNLMRLPHTPAPTRADAPARQRKSGGSTRKAPRTEPRRVNADKTIAADGEPLPDELAEQRAGRQPAPLGANSENR